MPQPQLLSHPFSWRPAANAKKFKIDQNPQPLIAYY
jgi:hypothetical protein